MREISWTEPGGRDRGHSQEPGHLPSGYLGPVHCLIVGPGRTDEDWDIFGRRSCLLNSSWMTKCLFSLDSKYPGHQGTERQSGSPTQFADLNPVSQ